MILLFSVTSVLWALIWLCIAVGVFYLVMYILGALGVVIPPKIRMIIGLIFMLLVIIWVINEFFGSGGGGHMNITR
jgi:uncharacterized membrane protein